MTLLDRDPLVVPEVRSRRTGVWFTFALVSLLALAVLDLRVWTVAVLVVGAGLAAVPRLRPPSRAHVDREDLVVLGVVYLGVVGLFLCFAAGLLLGVVGPVVYQVWVRGRDLRSLGLGTHRWRGTLAMGLALAAAQFAVTLLGYSLPAAEQWVPLLGMSLVVGLFEAVFFRGFVQGRLEASFGPVAGVAGAAALYAVYHVGYGMGPSQTWFLLGLGVVYAVAYRLTENVLMVWPLLSPVGAFFTNLDSGDIDLPWASLMGFADVAVVMAAAIWFAHRRIRRLARTSTVAPGAVDR